jgi:mono/diheme cytochrome c family protein
MRRPSLLSLLLPFVAVQGVAAHEAADVLFVRRIRPLLEQKCLACHGRDESGLSGGLDLRTREAALAGGDSGEASLVPGKPDRSPLYLAALRTADWEAMPPKESERLSADELGWLEDWIAGGAPWPDEARSREITAANEATWSAEDGATVTTSGGLSAEWTNRRYKPDGLWAYQPVRKPDVPPGRQHPVDALLAVTHPAPAADAATFIRRAHFDLTGLPPAPEEVDAFARAYAADADAAVADLVDRLLDSPHYGERMAQHWLDVTRYADSAGFANDYDRGNAWRYRDYVVRSFNADKPYDRFIREQVAGDEIAPDDPELLVATGFLRMGPWELTGMEVPKVARQRFLDDVTNAVGETFLAHSLQCARCHDHKFDPVPTGDYYAIQAVFATTQLAERPAAFRATENVAGFEERKHLLARRDELVDVLRRLDEKLLGNARNWFVENDRDPARWNAAVAEVAAAGGVSASLGFREHFTAARNLLLKQGVAEDEFPPRFVGFTPEEFGADRVARKGLERLRWEMDRYEPIALAVYAGRTPEMTSVYAPLRMPKAPLEQGELEETCILGGGDPFSPTVPVKPGVLSALGGVQTAAIPEGITGRRAAFAAWLASGDNPLTTRAIVNRIWMWHFNRPIAGNPNNFGSTGRKPTHPALLDWLAATFVERGWSVKELHRVIMTSQAYRRNSHGDAAAHEEDYAVFRPRRLSAEELRDAMLAVTGELNRSLGGIPNRPEINLEAALQPRQVMGTFASAWVPNPRPEQRHRRSLYALKLRGLSDPLLEVFNAPAPDFSCECREASTVTPQVFSLFNGRATHARAVALADRVLRETTGDEAAIARLFALVLSRPPSEREQADCLAHWHETLPLVRDAPPRPSPPLEVRRDAVEENTGESFSFQERLHAYAEFVPDLQPADVDARTRALADVCLVLLNTNEFAYVH